MKLIAESGATKTDWRMITDDGQVRTASTPGLNPSVLDEEQIRGIISPVMHVLNPEGKSVHEIYFYGAGIVDDASAAPLADALSMWYPFAQMEFHSDMLAAARALFGDGNGVVAIMGTGSNSCLYEKGQIVRNIRPGGYILGDEGSGAALGKAFVSDFIKGLLPSLVEADFVREYQLDYQKIVQKVYREHAASAFLASFAPFILDRSEEPYVKDMIGSVLESFVIRSLKRYGAPMLKVGVVGSFGCACETLLREIGARHSIEFTSFLKSPIDKLTEYHGI